MYRTFGKGRTKERIGWRLLGAARIRTSAAATEALKIEMDYSGYIIEHFPMMDRENKSRLRKFADTIDDAVEYAESHAIDNEDYRIMINNAICDFLGMGELDLAKLTSGLV